MALHGKICYVEIPTDDIKRSASFYGEVFGWSVRERPNGSTAFDDATNEVSGSWIVGRPPSTDAGLLVYIMVDSVEGSMRAVESHGGVIVQPIGADAPEITARFTDPYGNLIGLYQEPTA